MLICPQRAAKHWECKCDSCPHRAYSVAGVTATVKGTVTVDIRVAVVKRAWTGKELLVGEGEEGVVWRGFHLLHRGTRVLEKPLHHR